MTVLGVVDLLPLAPITVHIATRLGESERCSSCAEVATIKDRDRVLLTDLPVFGRRARLLWRKRRWMCSAKRCPVGSWTETAPVIAATRLGLTDRAGRWATFQVGGHGRSVSEVASDLGCDWHTVNNAVVATMARSWSMTRPGSGRSMLWGWTRRCSSDVGSGGRSSGRPRSLTCGPGR